MPTRFLSFRLFGSEPRFACGKDSDDNVRGRTGVPVGPNFKFIVIIIKKFEFFYKMHYPHPTSQLIYICVQPHRILDASWNPATAIFW
jgi:hypothetical protein